MISLDIINSDDEAEILALEKVISAIRDKIDPFQEEMYLEGGKVSIHIGDNDEVAIEFEGISEELQGKIVSALES